LFKIRILSGVGGTFSCNHGNGPLSNSINPPDQTFAKTSFWPTQHAYRLEDTSQKAHIFDIFTSFTKTPVI